MRRSSKSVGSDEERICPSAPAEVGSDLIGVIGPTGRVGYLSPALPVSLEFLESARGEQSPEARFRFATTCREQGCIQWTGDRCGVIDVIVGSEQARGIAAAGLPACAVRSRCRWFSQRGSEACRVCPYVITDSRSGYRAMDTGGLMDPDVSGPLSSPVAP
jgi:hypothetical protein